MGAARCAKEDTQTLLNVDMCEKALREAPPSRGRVYRPVYVTFAAPPPGRGLTLFDCRTWNLAKLMEAGLGQGCAKCAVEHPSDAPSKCLEYGSDSPGGLACRVDEFEKYREALDGCQGKTQVVECVVDALNGTLGRCVLRPLANVLQLSSNRWLTAKVRRLPTIQRLRGGGGESCPPPVPPIATSFVVESTLRKGHGHVCM